MIDRVSRDKLAETLRHYVSGRVSNDELDNLDIKSDDLGVKAIKDASWFLYDDLYEHKAVGRNRINKGSRHEISIWIVFLQSEKEYVWLKPSVVQKLVSILTLGFYKKKCLHKGDKEGWPFFKNKDLESAKKKPKLFRGKNIHN